MNSIEPPPFLLMPAGYVPSCAKPIGTTLSFGHGTGAAKTYNPARFAGFAGSPFTTHIDNGAFSFRLFNGTRYDDMHWCRDELCGVFRAPDDTATPVDFVRPEK